MKRNHKIYKLSICFVLISFVLSTTFALLSQKHMLNNNQKEVDTLIASNIQDSINQELSKIIIIANTVTSDDFVIDFLAHKEEHMPKDEAVAILKDHLSFLNRELNCDSMLIVSEKTRRYISEHGFNKIVDPIHDTHDIWYQDYKDCGKDFNINVDTDQVSNDALTVFINAGIKDIDVGFLGCFCVGTRMTQLQKILKEYEDKYQLDIALVRDDGLVQVATDNFIIEKAYLDIPSYKEKVEDEYLYHKDKDNNCIVTKYMPILDWFLIVKSKDLSVDNSFYKIVFINLGLFILFALLMALTALIIFKRNQVLTKFSYIDEMTKLNNRRSYEEDTFHLAQNSLDDDFIYVNIDVNSLKKANDTLGHEAGDELIKGAAICLDNAFSKYGTVYRMGGDEFSAVLYMPHDDYLKLETELQKEANSWSGEIVKHLSISIGHVALAEDPNRTLDEIVQTADTRMYEAKSEYYRQTGLDRRKI